MDYGKYVRDADVGSFLRARQRAEWSLSLTREYAGAVNYVFHLRAYVYKSTQWTLMQ
jgi:hypothetical protein